MIYKFDYHMMHSPFMQTILDWFVQLSFGLKYIHNQHILHRGQLQFSTLSRMAHCVCGLSPITTTHDDVISDLKTQNVFLAAENLIKIGDFGISRMMTSSIGTCIRCLPKACICNALCT